LLQSENHVCYNENKKVIMFKNYSILALAALCMLSISAYNDGFDYIRPDKGRDVPVSEQRPGGYTLVEVENKGGGTRVEFKPMKSEFRGWAEPRYMRNERKDDRYYDQD
jgi:hypothetical protein